MSPQEPTPEANDITAAKIAAFTNVFGIDLQPFIDGFIATVQAMDAILEADNIVLVHLPEPTAPDFTGLEWRDSAAGWDVFAYGSTKHRGQLQIRTPEFVVPETARNLAAALLGAANAADAADGVR